MIPDMLANDVKAKEFERQQIQSDVDEFLKTNEIKSFDSSVTTVNVMKQGINFTYSKKPQHQAYSSQPKENWHNRETKKRQELKGLTFGSKR